MYMGFMQMGLPDIFHSARRHQYQYHQCRSHRDQYFGTIDKAQVYRARAMLRRLYGKEKGA